MSSQVAACVKVNEKRFVILRMTAFHLPISHLETSSSRTNYGSEPIK